MKIKHLEFIQSVINRFSSNSFLIKGWVVTITVAAIGFNIEKQSSVLLMGNLACVIMFWILDGYYLHKERCFRKLYIEVSNLEESEINFSMDIKHIKGLQNSWLFSIVGTVSLIFYLSLILLNGIVYFYLFN